MQSSVVALSDPPVYKTKQEYVHEQLRHAVLRGHLPPGEVLVAQELADRYGVSSAPVREALQRLKNEGLVDGAPHARTVVKGMSKAEALEIAELRLLLEPAAARAATPHIGADDLAELERLLATMDGCVERNETGAYTLANERFHLAIYARCPNGRLRDAIVECWELSQRFAVLAGFPRQIGKGQREHRLICDALKGGDAERVERSTREHRERVLESMRTWSEDRPTT